MTSPKINQRFSPVTPIFPLLKTPSSTSPIPTIKFIPPIFHKTIPINYPLIVSSGFLNKNFFTSRLSLNSLLFPFRRDKFSTNFKSNKKDFAWQIIKSLALSIQAMDFKLNGLTIHGGLKGCRFSEVVATKDLPMAKCNNFFKANTHANLGIEIRPVQGQDTSELHRFWVHYDRFPGKLGTEVNGFYFLGPQLKGAKGPLENTRSDSFLNNVGFRNSLYKNLPTPIEKPIPPLISHGKIYLNPIGWVFDDLLKIKFDLTKNILSANGLISPKIYQDLQIPQFTIPRRIDKLLTLISQRIKCYTLRKDSIVKHPNLLKGFPPLVDWLNPKGISAEIYLRKTSISLGPLGKIEIAGQGLNRIRINGNSHQTIIEIELGKIPNLIITQNKFRISARQLKTKKIYFHLPSVQQLTSELGLRNQKTLKQRIAECFDPNIQTKSNKNYLKFFEKLLKNVKISGIKAGELRIEQLQRGFQASLTNPEIKKITINGFNAIVLHGLGSSKFELSDLNTETKISLEKGILENLKIERGDFGPNLILSNIRGKNVALHFKAANLHNDQINIEKLFVNLTKKNYISLLVKNAISSGNIRHHYKRGALDLHTSGNSKISSLKAIYQKKPIGGDTLDTQLKFSGKINDLSVSDRQLGNFHVINTIFRKSFFKLHLQFPPPGILSQPKSQFKISLDVENAQIKNGHFGIAELGNSQFKNTQVIFHKDPRGFTGKVFGSLHLRIQELNLPPIAMPLKGSSLEGKIQDIQVRGQGILEIDKNKISLQKIPDLTNQNFLSITGKFKHFIFKDNPIRRNPKLKYYPHSKIIKTKMEILDAQIIVKDLQSFVFKRPTPFQKSSLQKLALKSLSIHDILARGIIWGNFSLPLPLRWVDGTFPKIGKEFDPKTNKVESSRISFDSIRILNDPKIKQTEVQNGLIYLYEEKGHKQYLKIKIHDLNLDPKKLFFKKDPVIGWKFSVPARGGAFESGTIEPDLSERRTRPIRRRAKSVRRKGVSRHHTPKK